MKVVSRRTAPSAPAVVAVHVAEERRRDHGVVKRCVEDPSHRRIGCFDADFRQLAVPCPAGGFAHGFEIPAGALRLHVPPGIFRGNGRKPDLDGDAFVLLRPKTEASVEFPPAAERPSAESVSAPVKTIRSKGFENSAWK